MFKNLKVKTSISKGLFGRVYKEQPYLYIDGVLINKNYEVIAENISLTRAAKLITEYPAINGRTWFKKISVDELSDTALEKLKEMGLLNESHQ